MSLSGAVEAAKDGDQEAWNQLVERYIPLVMSVTRRFGLRSDDAADVNQTLWLRLVEHLADIREPHALPGWIVTTVSRESMRLLKSRKRDVVVDPMDGFSFRDSEDPEVDEDLLRAERQQTLRDAMAELKTAHRELLLLLMTDPPLSYDEISAQLDMPKGSIGPTRARALTELRKTRAMQAFLTPNDEISGR